MIKQVLILLSLFLTTVVYAIDLTKEPIQVIIPFSPGGGVDATYKSIMNYATKQNIKLVPMYKPGAEGLIGMNELSKSKNDGFTIGLVTTGNIAIYRMKNKTDNIKPVMGIRNAPIAVVVNANSSIKTLADYENAIKNDSKFSFGFAGPAQRMYFTQLTELMRVKNEPTIIPYKGGSNVITDLLGGHITSAILPYNIISTHVDTGSLRIVAINSSTVPVNSPNAKLLQKQYSHWEDFDWYCLVMPPDTNHEITKAWITFINQYLSDPATLDEFKRDNIELVSRDPNKADETVKIFITKSN
jgi:tripartite-type tricarboxylate transporter receptor subunit TctC